MTKLNIEGHDQWKMDEESGSIELVNKSEYEKYMLRVESEKREKEMMMRLVHESHRESEHSEHTSE